MIGALLLAATVTLSVRETAGVARTGEVVRSGIPLPRTLGVTSTAPLAVVDGNGTPVPAEFRVLARWNAGRNDAGAPIQWVLASFPASAGARATATYRLITDGTTVNPPPATPLQVTKNGNLVTINTGAATFIIDGDKGSLFEEIRFIGGAPLVTGGSLTARVDGADVGFAAPRRVMIESAGPLVAVIVVEGTYGAQLASQRRYVFTAGSRTAIIRQTLAWEATRCENAGAITCGPSINAVRVERVRDVLRIAVPPTAALAIGAREAGTQRATIAAGATASLRQLLRPRRTAPPRFELALGDVVASGTKADGGVLAVETPSGVVAVALDHMHRYEPQALRLLGDGSLAIDVADDTTWIGARQALFATMAVAILPPNTPLEPAVWAPLNRPLRAWPDAAWFAASEAVEVPAGVLPAELAGYDDATRSVLERTVRKTDELGVFGLMTFGLFPRAWGSPILSDEIDCFGNDPTPGESWDDLYWCSTWTDYHNAAATAPIRAMRGGEVEWLDEIARPAALRMLYTQVEQCSPADGWFYCGQAPAGYGGYRADFNSSHAYFDNLQTYYWLTGDYPVVETLQRGARSMRNYLCSRRPAASCRDDDAPIDEFANLIGRVASQWFSAFRFVGLAGDDASYLDDYRSGLSRAVTQQLLALDDGGKRYGFLLGDWRPVTQPGTSTTDQLWMTGLYDAKNLDRLRRDTGDTPIGTPAIRPSEVIAALARTMARFGPPNGWPNQLDVTWSGPRVGGSILAVRANGDGSDPLLYDTGKAALAGLLAAASSDPSIRPVALEMTRLAIDASLADGSPLGKIQAEYLARLHAAVAALAGPPATVPRRRAARP